MKAIWGYMSVVGPLLLAVAGGIVTFVPALAESSRLRWTSIAFFVVVGALTAVATKIENDRVSASITGGDNYAFITIDANAKAVDGSVPLVMVNRGSGPVFDVKYWPYPGSIPLGANDDGYWDLKEQNRRVSRSFDWVNPRAQYRTGQYLPPGDYMIEVEARNGAVLEHLRIDRANGFTAKVVVTRDGRVIHSE